MPGASVPLWRACAAAACARYRAPGFGATRSAGKPATHKEMEMLHYAVVFLVIALIAALFGFGGIAAGAVGIAKILFFVFVIMAVVTFVLGLLKKGFPMSLQTATDKVTHGVRNLADDVLQSAQDAVQTTRAAADQSLDKAEESVRALRRQTDPAIDDLAARAQDLAARSIDYCAETSARARRQIQQAAEVTGKYVAEQPGKSLVIAAASGALLATVAMWMSRRRNAY
eukprot:gene2944-2985_t